MGTWTYRDTDTRKANRARKQAAKQARKRLVAAAPDLLAACRAVVDYRPNARKMVVAAVGRAEGVGVAYVLPHPAASASDTPGK